MTTLKNHPQFWLSPAAAASLERFEAAHGVIQISSAGRTESEQQGLINRWNKGGAANRPPHLYKPAMPAGSSRHVFGGGLAVDTNNQAVMHAHGEEFGWYFNFAYDVVHFEYEEGKDLHLSAGGAITTSSQATLREQAFLNEARGEKLKADGIKGPATTDAFKRYEQFLKEHYGYTGAIDGIWGPGVQAAHTKYYDDLHKPAAQPTGRPTVRKGSSGDQVKILQDRLNGRYPAYSKLANDGKFGTGTENVVKEFQRRAGLTPDGVVGPKTWSALGL